MNSQIKLLDCTVREAPIENLMFYEDYLIHLFKQLTETGIELVEVGFLKDAEHKKGSTIFSTVEQIETYLPKDRKNTLFFALVDYGRFSVKNLSKNNGRSIDGIRICFKKGEQDSALELAKEIIELGYLVSIQQVDTLSYTSEEILSFIHKVNDLNPYAYSIVDTFGAMYEDDVKRLYDLVNENLSHEITLGFHAHNNLMLATSNAQEFINMSKNSRNVVIDGSIMGCGRGAGNAHLELLVEFLNKKYYKEYKFDILLDLIDEIVPYLRKKAKWGYSIPYFISGMYESHVYNVNHLLRRHNIGSKDLRNIINNLDLNQRKKYDYKLLEELYIEYFNHEINDIKDRDKLVIMLKGKPILLLAPGNTLISNKEKICEFINTYSPIIIDVNNDISIFHKDFIFCSSPVRYARLRDKFTVDTSVKKIITSNIKIERNSKEYVIDYKSLIKYGWINLDNSIIMLLRLLLDLNVKCIDIAGFDGFVFDQNNFYLEDIVSPLEKEDISLLNKEVQEMFLDVNKIANNKNIKINMLTKSIYEVF